MGSWLPRVPAGLPAASCLKTQGLAQANTLLHLDGPCWHPPTHRASRTCSSILGVRDQGDPTQGRLNPLRIGAPNRRL